MIETFRPADPDRRLSRGPVHDRVAASGITHVINTATSHGIDVGMLTAAKGTIEASRSARLVLLDAAASAAPMPAYGRRGRLALVTGLALAREETTGR